MPSLLTDFQHNKDWNKKQPPDWQSQKGLLTDFQHNKDWNRNIPGQVLTAIPLTHWFPAQQGLKRAAESYFVTIFNAYSLISSTTRIETQHDWSKPSARIDLLTDFQHNKDWN